MLIYNFIVVYRLCNAFTYLIQDMPCNWCSTETPEETPEETPMEEPVVSRMVEACAYIPTKAVWISTNGVWPWKKHNIITKIYVEFRNVHLLSNWTIDNGQPMNTDTILRYANTWSDMGDGKIPRFVDVECGRQAQIRVSFNSMLRL